MTRPAWLRRPRFITVVMAGLWIYLAVRLAPHLAAVVGIETGGRAVPAYDLPTLAGGRVSGLELRGKVVLVNFWATWCLPCRAEMPLLEAMYQRYRAAGLVVVGLSVDRGPPADVVRFLAERGITYPAALAGMEVERAFGGVAGYPTSFLLDREGKIRQRAMGPLAMVSFEPAVRRLLDEAPARPVRP